MQSVFSRLHPVAEEWLSQMYRRSSNGSLAADWVLPLALCLFEGLSFFFVCLRQRQQVFEWIHAHPCFALAVVHRACSLAGSKSRIHVFNLFLLSPLASCVICGKVRSTSCFSAFPVWVELLFNVSGFHRGTHCAAGVPAIFSNPPCVFFFFFFVRRSRSPHWLNNSVCKEHGGIFLSSVIPLLLIPLLWPTAMPSSILPSHQRIRENDHDTILTPFLLRSNNQAFRHEKLTTVDLTHSRCSHTPTDYVVPVHQFRLVIVWEFGTWP